MKQSSSRIYNSKVNIGWGVIVTFLNTLITFVSRTVFVKCLGTDYLGLNSLFMEIVTMLSLAELGVGMAINFSLYKPIHENDRNKINQLMTLFKKSYNVIALVIFIIGLTITPAIHLIVNGTHFSTNYIRIVFFLFVINTSSSYLFSYNTSFINANQKQYIVSLANVVVKIIFSTIQIVELLLFSNYIVFMLLSITQTLFTNIYLAHYVKKHYPFISYTDSLPQKEVKKIFSDIKNIFVKRLSGVLTSSTANIFISTFVSTIQVGIYSNYILLLSLFKTLNGQFSNGIKASIGDLLVSENEERCISVLRRLTFMFFVFALFSCSFLQSFCSPFITLWLGAQYTMEEHLVFLIIFNLFLSITFQPLWEFLEVSGLFKQDRNIAIIGSTFNLLLAFVGGYYWGMIGIFLGAISSQVLQFVLKMKLLFNMRFYSSNKKFMIFSLKIFMSYFILMIIHVCFIGFIDLGNIYYNIVMKGIMALLVPLFIIVILWNKTAEYSYLYAFINDYYKRVNLNKSNK